jgi:hypothetical protein
MTHPRPATAFVEAVSQLELCLCDAGASSHAKESIGSPHVATNADPVPVTHAEVECCYVMILPRRRCVPLHGCSLISPHPDPEIVAGTGEELGAGVAVLRR